MVEQARRNECVEHFGHHLAGYAELNGKVSMVREAPVVVGRHADKVEPPTKVLVG
jgi:methionine synthase II (cobalamin-independent)